MTSCIEHTSTIDGAQTKTSKQKGLKENSMIKGFVTMIKNEGRADEQILCKNKPNHSTGTNSTTLNKIFTASGTHTAVQKSGTFNQLAVGGTIGHEAVFTPVTLASSDTLSVTWTLTLG